MNLRTISSTWYEAVMVGGYGCKLANTYDNKKDAVKAIKEAKAKEEGGGYVVNDYFILLCNCVRMIDDKGDTVSETIARVRV